MGVMAYPLFGNFAIMRREKTQSSPSDTPADIRAITEADRQSMRAAQAERARNNRQLSKRTEDIQVKKDTEGARQFATKNNAAMTHLETFIGLVRYAEENALPLAMGEFGKTFKEEDARKEWKRIQSWLGKYRPDVCAVSIGRRPKGRWVIRMIIVGNHGEGSSTQANPFRNYLEKRGWQEQSYAADQEAARLKDHYLIHNKDAGIETFDLFLSEMVEVGRAALVLPYRGRRTFRSDAAQGILNSNGVPVIDDAAYPVQGLGRSSSPSGKAICEVEIKDGAVVTAWLAMDEEARQLNPEGVFHAEF